MIKKNSVDSVVSGWISSGSTFVYRVIQAFGTTVKKEHDIDLAMKKFPRYKIIFTRNSYI